MKKLLLILLCFPVIGFGQTTDIPDDNFENYLETHDANGYVVAVGDPTSMGNGTLNDNLVLTANITTVGDLSIVNQGIFDLTGIEDFLWLENLYCSGNQLTSLDVSYNQYLLTLDCSNNWLTSLDVSGATWLLDFYCNNNQLPSLDVSYNIGLDWLDCGHNQLTSLDVSNCSSLGLLWCDNNQLASLDVRSGNNINMFFNSLNNPNLACINVDDANWSTTNWPDIDTWTSFNTNCPQVVFGCTDSAYAEYNSLATIDDGSCLTLLVEVTFNVNMNTQTVSPNGIHITGDFQGWDPAATEMFDPDLDGVYSITLDLNAGGYYEYKFINGDSWGQDENMNNWEACSYDDGSCGTNCNRFLNVGTDSIQDLGIVCFESCINCPIYGCINPIACNYDSLANTDDNSCDLPNGCGDSLYLEYIPNLTCPDDANSCINLIVSGCLNPTACNYNSAANFDDGSCDLPSGCGNILYLEYDVNVTCSDQNACLTFIVNGCMDATATNYNSLANVDDGSCTYISTYVPDDNFENYLEANGMGDGIALNNYVTTANINTVITLTVNGLNISDLTGIEAFTALEGLYCFGNQLTSLDLNQNTAVSLLVCSSNQLTSLNVSPNIALTELMCVNNQLTSLDVSSNVELIHLDCYNNQITSLDVSANPDLTFLNCGDNNLTSLDLRNGNNTALITFYAASNPNLLCINVDDVSYSTTNWTNIDPQSSFSLNCIVPGCTDTLACNYDSLATIDDTSCVYLDIIAITTSVSCFGMFDGSIAATAAGGTFPLQYSLGAGLSQTSGTFSNLSAGTYYIDVTDVNSCTSNQMVIITEPAPLSISVDSTDETSALNDGSATAIISGGTAPYFYLWDDPLAQTTPTATNLAPGLYTVVVTDVSGCIISDATSVNAYIPTGIINIIKIKNTSRTLLKVTDILGKETPHKRNRTLFYIYDDGTVEKRIVIK